jgi:hypothetical protein
MHVTLPVVAVWANVGLLTLAGLVNVTSFKAVRALYADLDIPELFYRTIGMLQILAAVFLASPEMRVYGILIAAPIMFGAVVTLLNHRRYAVAVPVMLMMAALVVATLAVAPVHSHYSVQFAAPSIAETAALANSIVAGAQS